MEKIVLNATKREIIGKKVKHLRSEGKLPAVIYGKTMESIPVELDLKEATRILSTVSPSTLLMINLDGKEYPTLVRERQVDYIYRNLLHVDFQVVSLTEKVRAKVRVALEGEAPAEKDFNAIISPGLEEIEIECLPTDLIDQITVDLSVLESIGDTVFVKDLNFPPGIEVLEDPEAMVVIASPPEAQEEEEVEEELLEEEAEPEVIEKGKAEDEEEE